MKRNLWVLVVMAWVSVAGLAVAGDRWVHVKVIQNGEDGDRVRVNIPLSLAEKVLPTINSDKLHNGKIRLDGQVTDKVDLRALLEAVRNAQDNEFVTVDSGHQNVRVAKSGGFLLIKVHDAQGAAGKPSPSAAKRRDADVDVKIPFTVASALLSGKTDELNLLAAVQALDAYPDVDLVTVHDTNSTVRIWVDSKSAAD